MPLTIGETKLVQGSAREPYKVKNCDGTIFSCTCPGWRNSPGSVDQKTCKHTKPEKLAYMTAIGAPIPAVTAVPVAKPATKKSVSKASIESSEAPVLLAQAWESNIDPDGWWMSIKMDGIRAFFNGKDFISRLGNKFEVPDWFKSGLPDVPLDGELWIGRKSFQETVSIVKRKDQSGDWSKIKFMVFDAPTLNKPFEQRLQDLQNLISNANYAQYVEHTKCTGRDHLQQELQKVTLLGDEGLMLRKPNSMYEVGRSSTLLKVKIFHDEEALVIGHSPGKGKHKGKLGALICSLNDIQFNVGSGFTDEQRLNPPPIGSKIVFAYQEKTKDNVPRFPVFLRTFIEM